VAHVAACGVAGRSYSYPALCVALLRRMIAEEELPSSDLEQLVATRSETDRQTETERQTERDRETERQRDRETETDREAERQRQ
jgi:hypothetical protein